MLKLQSRTISRIVALNILAVKIRWKVLAQGIVREHFWQMLFSCFFLDYKNHPCRRDCLRTTSMTCEYNFTVEHYQTLSRACYNCPFNMTDCHRPHCVPADGFLRAIKVVNRMMPGPALHVSIVSFSFSGKKIQKIFRKAS